MASADKNTWDETDLSKEEDTGGIESGSAAHVDGTGITVKLPGAASLYEQLDKLVLVCLRDGRIFYGWLRSFDQYANLTLDNTVERLSYNHFYTDIQVGIFVIRGENVMLLGQVDEQKELAITSTLEAVPEKKIRQLLATRESEDAHAHWAIPEEM